MGMVSFGKMTMAKQQTIKETSGNPVVLLYRGKAWDVRAERAQNAKMEWSLCIHFYLMGLTPVR
jgi:hypothetical protein